MVTEVRRNMKDIYQYNYRHKNSSLGAKTGGSSYEPKS